MENILTCHWADGTFFPCNGMLTEPFRRHYMRNTFLRRERSLRIFTKCPYCGMSVVDENTLTSIESSEYWFRVRYESYSRTSHEVNFTISKSDVESDLSNLRGLVLSEIHKTLKDIFGFIKSFRGFIKEINPRTNKTKRGGLKIKP